MPPPERLGRYELGERIGEGGMGVVFRARLLGAEGFSKLVAIKRIHESLARDPGIRDAFVIEAVMAQRLHHGNIVQLFDVGLDQNVPYLVIEHIDGASLDELLRASDRPLPIADALHIAESVADALAYAHGLADAAGRPEGLVHRDVTPRNILLSRDGVVKLADFGIAKAMSAPSYTLPGTFKGSLGYLAPEQARGEPVDARADQFSLGVVLHEMLGGRNPIAARDVDSYHRAIQSGVPPLAAAPPADAELAAIVSRATALDRTARYGSMDELRSELEAWRVARKIRTSGESLRDAMRDRLGGGATAPAPRPLGEALRDQLPPSVPTQRIASAVRADARRGAPDAGGVRRRLLLAGAALVVLAAAAAIAVGVARRAPASPASEAGAPPAVLPPLPSPGPAPAADAAPVADAADDAPARDRRESLWDAPARPTPRSPGRLRVNVVPWATVLLDDRPLGGVPIDLEIAAGRHRVTLHSPDTGERVERWIEIPPGGLAEVTSW